MSRIEILGAPVDNMTMQETVDEISRAIDERKQIHHVVVNVAKLVNMRRDEELRKSVVDCDIINVDGMPIVWASKFLGNPLKERVAGIDLMMNLIRLSTYKKYRIFLLGATNSVLQKVVENISKNNSPGIIAGYRDGYFSEQDSEIVAREIADSNADILFVAISSPKKEIFLNRYKRIINTPFIMGVGGSFDILAGVSKRAPLFFQNAGLEWLYRIYQEPRRMWKRYAATNPVFIYLVFKEKLKLAFKRT